MDITKTLLIIAVILVLGGGAWFFLSSNKSDGTMMEKDDTAVMEKADDAMIPSDAQAMEDKKDEGVMIPNQPEADTAGQMEKPSDTMTTKGSYEAYAPEKLAKANEGDVVLFFRASWCPTCRALHADIQANAGAIPAGVTILDVDYDSSTALKQKYGVTYQHTLVQVDANGNLIKKWMGSPTLAGLIPNIQ